MRGSDSKTCIRGVDSPLLLVSRPRELTLLFFLSRGTEKAHVVVERHAAGRAVVLSLVSLRPEVSKQAFSLFAVVVLALGQW
jgi:hypothetical protein